MSTTITPHMHTHSHINTHLCHKMFSFFYLSHVWMCLIASTTHTHTHILSHTLSLWGRSEQPPAVCIKNINHERRIMYGKQNNWLDQRQLLCPLSHFLFLFYLSVSDTFSQPESLFVSLHILFILSPSSLSVFPPPLFHLLVVRVAGDCSDITSFNS